MPDRLDKHDAAQLMLMEEQLAGLTRRLSCMTLDSEPLKADVTLYIEVARNKLLKACKEIFQRELDTIGLP